MIEKGDGRMGEEILRTERLILTRLTLEDAPFILGLLNEPSFIENIGDKGARDLDGAREYLRLGPLASYQQWGFGLFLTSLLEDRTPIGTCGLLQRDNLSCPDVGFAFKPQFWGRGYATESAAAVMEWGRRTLGIEKIVAITSEENDKSAAVLRRVGLELEKRVVLLDDEPPVRLFS